MKKLWTLIGMLTLGGLSAYGDIIPTYVNTTPNGANFNWNYQVDATIDSTVQSGTSYFTLYDLIGVVGTSQPSGWSSSIQNVGITPPQVLVTDNASVSNVTWTRTGSNIVGPADLGTFTVISTSGNLGGVVDFASTNVRSTGPLAGTPLENRGLIQGPGAQVVIPEPSTFALLGGSLLVLGLMRRKR